VIVLTLHSEPNALTLQFRQQRDQFEDTPCLLAADQLLFRIRQPIAILCAGRSAISQEIGPIAPELAAAVDPLIAGHAKEPRPHVLDQQPFPPRGEQPQEGLLSDFFGLPVRASQGAQEATERLAQFVKRLLDFPLQIIRVVFWPRDKVGFSGTIRLLPIPAKLLERNAW
jgi:hypothetical protein